MMWREVVPVLPPSPLQTYFSGQMFHLGKMCKTPFIHIELHQLVLQCTWRLQQAAMKKPVRCTLRAQESQRSSQSTHHQCAIDAHGLPQASSGFRSDYICRNGHTWRNGHSNDLKQHPYPDVPRPHYLPPLLGVRQDCLTQIPSHFLPELHSSSKNVLSTGSFQIDWFLETRS